MITDCHIHIQPLALFHQHALQLMKKKRPNFAIASDFSVKLAAPGACMVDIMSMSCRTPRLRTPAPTTGPLLSVPSWSFE